MLRQLFYWLDGLSFALAGWVALAWRFGIEPGIQHAPGAFWLCLAAGLLMVFVSAAVYRNWRGGGRLAMMGRVGLAWLIVWGVLMTWLVLSKTSTDYSRLWLLAWAATSLVFGWAARLALMRVLMFLRSRGYNRQRVVLLGEGDLVAQLGQRVNTAGWTGYDLVGSVSTADRAAMAAEVERLRPDEVWICQPVTDLQLIQDILRELRYCTANIRLVPDMGVFQ